MSDTEEISIAAERDGQALWEPTVGPEARGVVEHAELPEQEGFRVLQDAHKVLSRCTPPRGSSPAESRTGIVIGRVQSGKTLSFTTLTALARDNGFRLVIVLAGTNYNILEQNSQRMAEGLGITTRDNRGWRHLDVRATGEIQEVSQVLSQTLRRWERYREGSNRPPPQTVLLTLLKNHSGISQLAAKLGEVELGATPTLIIDDEGDQASLNTQARQGEESATFAAISALRAAVGGHTYLQYTATPQAPLLISRIDKLSPEFTVLIHPGNGYVGGERLFYDGSPYIKTIPPEDIPDQDQAPEHFPESLERALRLYLLGVAVEWAQADGLPPVRSMMVHPSVRVTLHREYIVKIGEQLRQWGQILNEDENNPDRRDLIEQFREAYRDLEATLEDAPGFAAPDFDEIAPDLGDILDETQVYELNASEGPIPVVPWHTGYSFILVGGTGLDRGFTVSGLTVTYMPRSAGVGNADTIQQRGRFFGYKSDHLPLIRIFLEYGVEEAFEAYVEHERSIWDALERHERSGEPLSEWRRLFFLDGSLRPTRQSVLRLDSMRSKPPEWVYSRTSQTFPRVVAENREIVDGLRQGWDWEKIGEGTRYTPDQRHFMAHGVGLGTVYREILVPWRVGGDPREESYQLALTLAVESWLEEEPEAKADVYLINQGERRERGLDNQDRIQNLFQGRNPGTDYPGDRALKHPKRLTVQLHRVDLHPSGESRVKYEDVPILAANLPEGWRRHLFVETSSG